MAEDACPVFGSINRHLAKHPCPRALGTINHDVPETVDNAFIANPFHQVTAPVKGHRLLSELPTLPPTLAPNATTPSPTVTMDNAPIPRLKKVHRLKSAFRRLGAAESPSFLFRHRHSGNRRHLELRARLERSRQVFCRHWEAAECLSCCDAVDARHSVRLRCHCYCKPCFARLVANALDSEANWPPRCCLGPIDHKTCLRNIPKGLSARYRRKRLEYSTPVEDRYYCPVPDCGLFVPLGRISKLYRLAECKKHHKTCMDCLQAAHDDVVQCPKARDLERLAAEAGWRRCHRCRTMIEHADACRHIKCRCGAEFCYVCGAVWYTCGCTELQLEEIKKRARRNALRRRKQEEQELREVEELHQALELVATIEAERHRKDITRQHADLIAQLDGVNRFPKTSPQDKYDVHWYDVVTAERARLLEENMVFDLEISIHDNGE